MTEESVPDEQIPGLSVNAFLKEDPSPDHLFYAAPRFVTHIDGNAVEAVTALYRDVLPAGGVILDLMSSWISHLPSDVAYAQVIGHGMNAMELKANPRLSQFFVQNLNENQVLPLDSRSIDAAMICVSIQYLQKPVVILRELMRVLKPGGSVSITFSNRCFPTKAVAVWQALPDAEHAKLVTLYLEYAGFAQVEVRTLVEPGQKGIDPLWAVIGRTA
jgi:SAM-dependent methyltransferase